MKDEQQGQTPGGDKLDQWIEQNLHMDAHKAHPAPAPEHKTKPEHHQKPAAAHHAHAASKQHKPHGQHQHGRKPFVGNQKMAAPGHTGHKTHASHAGPAAHKAPHGARASHPAAPAAEPKKKFFGIFGSRTGQDKKTSLSPFGNQRAHYRGKLRLIPVGGLDEVGKNCMILEYGNDIMLIDLGFQFPEEDMLGVDYVIPDLSYLDDKIDRIKGIVITHGHLDHVGGIPYVLQKLNFPPIYGTKLTNGLIEKRLEEFGLLKQSKLRNITKDDVIQLGQFNVSFFHVNHSIPDAVGVVVKTPAGNIAHTGDFKFDFTPSGDQAPPDFARLASLAHQDIAAFFMDSTNALKPGYTISEKKVGASLENVIKNTDGRVVIASFSSQIGRIQQIIDHAKKYNRTIYTSGRSLADNIFIASKLGYLKVPQGIIQDIRKMGKMPENKVIILTTGSQGEATSALTRIALEDHPNIKVKRGDTVVLSSSPIPGNERAVTTVTNNLCKLGAKIINNQIMDVHTSGHAQQEDLKLAISLVKPKAVVPVHGEYFMRYGLKEIAMSIGYADENAIIVENGGVIEVEHGKAKATGEVVETKYILVDGLGVGDIGAQVMMDRQTLAENGVLILVVSIDEKTRKIKKDVDVISRGFIYMKESEELVKEIASMARDAYTRVLDKRGVETKRGDIKKYIKETVDKFVHQKIERHPLVLPVIIEQ
ncbi:MAG: ribonuclease J [Candidatus Gracilibacteria bacterium]